MIDGQVIRPRVLLLVTHLDAGGAQETVLLLAEGLRRNGFDVSVAARPNGSEERRLRDLRVPLLPVHHLFREISVRNDFRSYVELRRIIRQLRPAVVHTHSSKAGVLGRLAARRSRTPAIIHTSHGLPVNPDMGRGQRFVVLLAEKVASRVSHRIVAVSHTTAREIRQLRIGRPDQIEIIPSGVNLKTLQTAPSRAEARAILGLPMSALVLGWVGRYFPQKRPGDVVLAAREVLRCVPEAIAVLVGDGPLLEQTRASVQDEPRIRILGHLDRIEVVYAAIDVFLLASAWEGLPRTVLEAQGAGVPVVSTAVNGIPDVVRHGETGFLVPPGDWRALASAATKLLNDPRLRTRMASTSECAIDSVYSANSMVVATATMYRTVLAEGS